MTKLNRGAARQSSAKAERPKTKAEGTVGRRSFLKAAALFAGGTAAGTAASPFLGNSKAQAETKTDRLYVTGRKPQTIENNQPSWASTRMASLGSVVTGPMMPVRVSV